MKRSFHLHASHFVCLIPCMSIRNFSLSLLALVLLPFTALATPTDTLLAHKAFVQGQAATQTNPSLAVTSYQQAFTLFAEAGETERALLAANKAGGLLSRQRANKEAAAWLEKSRTRLSLQPSVELGAHYHLLAKVEQSLGNFQNARQAGLTALKVREAVLPAGHPHISFTLINLGNTYTYLEIFDSTQWAIEKAITNWKIAQPEAHQFIADCHNSLANAYLKQGNFPAAEKGYRTRLEMLTALLDSTHPQIGLAFHNLGIYYERTGQYPEARRYYEKGLSIRKTRYSEGHPELAKSYNSMGILALNEGNYERARQLQTQALDIRTNSLGATHPLVGQSCNNLGNVYREMKSWEKAESYLMQALSIWQQLGPGYAGRVGATLNNLGNCKFDQGAYAAADSIYQLALSYYQSSQTYQISIQLNRGLCAIKLGQTSRALTLLKEAAKKRSDLLGRDHPRMSIIYSHLGEAYEVREEFDEAVKVYREGLAVLGHTQTVPSSEEWKSPKDRLACLAGLSRSWFAKANVSPKTAAGDSAWLYARLGARLLDSLTQQPWDKGSRTYWLSKGKAHLEKSLEVAFWLAESQQNPHWYERAFPLAEQHKSILLAAHRQQIEALGNAGIPDSLQQRNLYLRTRIGFYEQLLKRGDWQGNTLSPALAQEYRTTLFALRDSLQQFQQTLARTYPRYHAWKRPLAPVSLARLKSGLDEEQGIWTVFAGKKALYVWGITAHSLKASRFEVEKWPTPEPLRWLAEIRSPDNWELHTRSAPHVATYQQQTRAWFEGLLASVFPMSRFPKQLTVVPDGWLALMPFDALVCSPKPAENFSQLDFLIRHCSISSKFSLRQISPTLAPERDATYAGFAPSYENSPVELGNLPFAIAEVTHAADLLQGEAYLAETATEAQFRRNGTNARILHLSGHARANDSLPGLSALYFSATGNPDQSEDDGILYAYELYELNIPAQVVVLNGCQTGYGSIAPGEGIMSMARAFAYAGCDQLVASLWSADDQTTQAISEKFFALLSAGKTPKEALHQAKLEFLSESPLSHPGFWGHLILIEAYTHDAPTFPWKALIIGVLIMAGIGLAYFVRQKRWG